MIAPASLKQTWLTRLGLLPLRTTPGHDCPGLIEAREASIQYGVPFFLHSGA